MEDQVIDESSGPSSSSVGFYFVTSIVLVSLPLVLYILSRMRADYIGWYNLGAGGLPHNLYGWFIQSILRLFARDVLATEVYSLHSEIAKGGRLGDRNWLADLPPRSGPRPTIAKWVAPHRQATQFGDPEINALLEEEFKRIIDANPNALTSKVSPLEGTAGAMFIAEFIPTPHAIAKKMNREIAHVHSKAEHSLHVVLSPADCIEVIENGWGERQPLGGRIVADEYLIIYTPRSEGELKVVCQIVRASAAFMTGGKEIA